MRKETKYKNNITCPLCGYEDKDSWELSKNDSEVECGNCGAILGYSRYVEVTYSAWVVQSD